MGADTLPPIRDFQLFLSEQKDIIFTSCIKSYYNYITGYFKNKPFTQENLRIMLNLLRTDPTEKGKTLKKSTLNKYIRVAKLIAKCMGVHEFDDFDGYRNREEESTPLGEIITDKEAKMIAEMRMKYHYRSPEQQRELNIKWKAVFMTMRFLGTPPVDLINMKRSNDRGTHFDYYRHKTHKHMIVPIPAQLRRCLDNLPRYGEYLYFKKPGHRTDQSINEEIKKRCLRLGIHKNVTSYSFRYSATAFSYMNCTDQNLNHLADIFGHTVEVAKKHYDKMKDPRILLDALMTSHPGLKKDTSIDSVKRLALDFLSRLIDSSKFEVELTIQPKVHNVRRLTIS